MNDPKTTTKTTTKTMAKDALLVLIQAYVVAEGGEEAGDCYARIEGTLDALYAHECDPEAVARYVVATEVLVERTSLLFIEAIAMGADQAGALRKIATAFVNQAEARAELEECETGRQADDLR